MQEFLLSFISFDSILLLDWKVKGPGLIIIGWFMVRTFVFLFKFRFIQAGFSFINAFIAAVILSRAGYTIQTFIFGS